jgi:ParB family chromosome partitioning protein
VVKKTGLGQGVSALFGESPEEEKFFECGVDLIVPNKDQPRHVFDDESLDELAESIKVNGIIQPLVVMQLEDNSYSLIAGERRLRASIRAGLSKVPVIVQEIKNDDTLLELALIENIQRTDLNPLEEAEGFKKLIDRFGYTQDEAAQRVGKKRSTVTNALRLLLLPDYIKQDLLNQMITEGHGRALLRVIDDPATLKDVRDQVIQKKLSVRQTEQLVRRLKQASVPGKSSKTSRRDEKEIPNSYRRALENQLTNRLNSRVVINQSGSRGKIEVEYYSFDDLERLVTIVMSEEA